MVVKKCFDTMVSLLLFLFIVSCSHFTPQVVETPQFEDWMSSGDTPKIVATLPFTNETEVEGLNQLVRESFYKHFSVRNFFDVEIKSDSLDATSALKLPQSPLSLKMTTTPMFFTSSRGLRKG